MPDAPETLIPVCVAGGTDIVGCFAACSADLPVHRGEIQCKVLGMGMESWDETGMYVSCFVMYIQIVKIRDLVAGHCCS